MPAQDFTNQLLVDIAGQRLAADVAALLVEGIVDDSRTSPDLFSLRFRDPANVVVEKARVEIGAAVTLAVASNESRTPLPLLVGEVTALEKEADGTGTFTVIRGLDKSHRLRGRRVASFREMTAADVAKRVAKNAGIEVGQVDPTPTVFEQVSQGNATDWEFLRMLAADVGVELSVESGKLEFRKPTKAGDAPAGHEGAAQSALVLEVGRNVLRLRAVVTSAEQVPSVEVRGWDDTQKRAVVGTAPAATTVAEVGAKPADLAKAFNAPVLVATHTPYATQSEVDAAAKALAEQVAGGFAELEAVIRGNPQVRAGTAVALANAGKPFDGKYTVTATRHVFEPDTGYTTWVTVSGFQDRTLYGLVAGTTDAAAQGSLGVVVGQVSDNRDPDVRGRVRLTFPWLSDDYVSDWARTVQPGAGGKRGALVVPEVGDEVLVAFEQGSFQRPYVLGGLHNGIDLPDEGEVPLVDKGSGAVNRRAIVSRTGHRLEMVEAANGPQGVRLATGDGKLTLDLDQKQTRITVHSDGTVEIEARNGVTIDAGTGSLKLTGQDIALSAKTGIKVDGGAGDVKVSSSTTCTIQAGLVRIN
ncbi:MAG TPA: VgrG-related protein [Frankiaceae bacterium]|nr:VgrG-related protein [Frankiaceae bacterium]